MPGDAPTPDDILNAIKATGFLMEQRVATCLESLGFHAWTGYPFADPEESKSREIDVRGYRQVRNEDTKLIVELELLCECKSNDNPFVFLTRYKREHDKRFFCPDQYVFPFDNYETRTGNVMTYLPGFRHFEFAGHHYYDREDQKAVQFCKIVRDKKDWTANQGGIYDAIFYPLAKAVLARKKATATTRRPSNNGWKSIKLFMPIVVLYGKIFDRCRRRQTGSEGNLAYYVCAGAKLKGRQRAILIDFTTEDGLEDFLRNKVIPFAEEIAAVPAAVSDRLAKGTNAMS